MKQQSYRFEPLNKDNKKQWLDSARACSYAPVNALDESFLDLQLNNGAAKGSVLIYGTDGNVPKALLPGEVLKSRIGPVSFKTLRSRFGGLLFRDDSFEAASEVRDFTFHHIIQGYYARDLKIDSIEVVLPVKIMLESSHFIDRLLPFYGGSVEVNSILYTVITDDPLPQLRANVRWEINKGLKNIEEAQILYKGNEDLLHSIITLERQKAEFLKIEPISERHFERILKSPYYHALVALLDSKPVAGVIVTYCNGLGTFNFNASTEIGKKLFVNKALLMTAIRELKTMGAKYFVLGCGREQLEDNPNVPNVTFFKRSLSTHEVANYRFMFPVSIKGHALLGIMQWKRRMEC